MLVKDESLQPYLNAVKTARASLRKSALNLADDEESRAALTDAKTTRAQPSTSESARPVDADAELTNMPTQNCPTPCRWKSSIGSGSREIRLGH